MKRIYHLKLMLLSLFLIATGSSSTFANISNVGYDQNVVNQDLITKGKITDVQGEPIIGAAVRCSNGEGTVTDLDGLFSIKAKKGDVLTITYVGYVPSSITIQDAKPINITLKEDNQQLSEVVVVGYGTAKKSDLTGSVESLRADKLNHGSVTNAAQMLEGKVAGLYINTSNQDPGTTNSILLRGVGSISGSSEPLIVIDGFPVSGIDVLNTLNTNNIEQIDVLKDASATAIYGSRGANGVIIITTKRGQSGTMKVEYSTKLTVSQLGRKVDMMNSDQYIRYYYDLANDPDFAYNSWALGYDGNYYPYELSAIGTMGTTDWQSEIQNSPTFTQDHNLLLSGGSDTFTYRVSGNFYDGRGVIGPYEYKRFNVDSKLAYNKDKFSFMANITFANEATNRTKNDFIHAIRFPTTVDKYDESGNLSLFPVGTMEWYDNPFYNEQNIDDKIETNTTRLYATASYDFLPGLKAEGRVGYERRFYEWYYYENERSNSLDKGNVTHSNNQNINLDFILSYNNEFGKHKIGAMAGVNYQSFRNRGADLSGKGFSSPLVKYYNMNGILEKTNREMSSFWDERKLSSYMARATYNYDDRYLLTVNFRVDGATQFGDNNKWGYFPSVALAWRINQEKFFHCDYINSLKLKVGYGKAGNAWVPTGRTQALIQYMPVYLGGAVENGVTWYPTDNAYYPNPNLKWEGSNTINVGAEIYTRHFGFDINVYRKLSYDLLMDRSRPVETGYSNITLNKGELENYGIEAKLEGYFSFGSKLNWTPSLLVAYNRNEIKNFDNDIVWNQSIWDAQKFYGYAGANREGYPINSFFVYEYAGVWQQHEAIEAAKYGARPGEAKFADIATSDSEGNLISNEPDGKIDDADRKFVGSSNPKFTGSITNRFSYGDWSLSFMFDGVFGKKVLNYNRLALMNPDQLCYGNLSTEALGRWTPDCPNTNIPSFTRPIDTNLAISTFCIEKGDFVRLRELSLAWNHDFNKGIIKRLGVSLTATNLFTITKYKGLNPDVTGIDGTYSLYPITRSYTLGLNVSF